MLIALLDVIRVERFILLYDDKGDFKGGRYMSCIFQLVDFFGCDLGPDFNSWDCDHWVIGFYSWNRNLNDLLQLLPQRPIMRATKINQALNTQLLDLFIRMAAVHKQIVKQKVPHFLLLKLFLIKRQTITQGCNRDDF